MPAYGALLGFADMSEWVNCTQYGVIRKRDGLTLGWISDAEKENKFEFYRKKNRRINKAERAEIAAFIAAKERRRKGGKRK